MWRCVSSVPGLRSSVLFQETWFSVVFKIDLETVILQKAVQWFSFFFFFHVKDYAAVALLRLSLVFSLWQERLKDLSCPSLVIIEILSEYKGLTYRLFILWSVNIRNFITQEYINPPNQHNTPTAGNSLLQFLQPVFKDLGWILPLKKHLFSNIWVPDYNFRSLSFFSSPGILLFVEVKLLLLLQPRLFQKMEDSLSVSKWGNVT